MSSMNVLNQLLSQFCNYVPAPATIQCNFCNKLANVASNSSNIITSSSCNFDVSGNNIRCCKRRFHKNNCSCSSGDNNNEVCYEHHSSIDRCRSKPGEMVKIDSYRTISRSNNGNSLRLCCCTILNGNGSNSCEASRCSNSYTNQNNICSAINLSITTTTTIASASKCTTTSAETKYTTSILEDIKKLTAASAEKTTPKSKTRNTTTTESTVAVSWSKNENSCRSAATAASNSWTTVASLMVFLLLLLLNGYSVSSSPVLKQSTIQVYENIPTTLLQRLLQEAVARSSSTSSKNNNTNENNNNENNSQENDSGLGRREVLHIISSSVYDSSGNSGKRSSSSIDNSKDSSSDIGNGNGEIASRGNRRRNRDSRSRRIGSSESSSRSSKSGTKRLNKRRFISSQSDNLQDFIDRNNLKSLINYLSKSKYAGIENTDKIDRSSNSGKRTPTILAIYRRREKIISWVGDYDEEEYHSPASDDYTSDEDSNYTDDNDTTENSSDEMDAENIHDDIDYQNDDTNIDDESYDDIGEETEIDSSDASSIDNDDLAEGIEGNDESVQTDINTVNNHKSDDTSAAAVNRDSNGVDELKYDSRVESNTNGDRNFYSINSNSDSVSSSYSDFESSSGSSVIFNSSISSTSKSNSDSDFGNNYDSSRGNFDSGNSDAETATQRFDMLGENGVKSSWSILQRNLINHKLVNRAGYKVGE